MWMRARKINGVLRAHSVQFQLQFVRIPMFSSNMRCLLGASIAFIERSLSSCTVGVVVLVVIAFASALLISTLPINESWERFIHMAGIHKHHDTKYGWKGAILKLADWMWRNVCAHSPHWNDQSRSHDLGPIKSFSTYRMHARLCQLNGMHDGCFWWTMLPT